MGDAGLIVSRWEVSWRTMPHVAGAVPRRFSCLKLPISWRKTLSIVQ